MIKDVTLDTFTYRNALRITLNSINYYLIIKKINEIKLIYIISLLFISLLLKYLIYSNYTKYSHT